VPFSVGATRGLEPAAFDGSADVGANGAGFFFESVFIYIPLQRGLNNNKAFKAKIMA
jgi:hypothetical protein